MTGGVFSDPPGTVGAQRFHDLHGVGVDAAGRVYVGMGGELSGTESRSFAPDGSLNWDLIGLTFVDSLDADSASDGVDLYTKHERFRMDYDLSAGSQATYQSFTLDRFRFPEDPRLHLNAASVLYRRIDGRPLMFIIGMYSSEVQVYRLDPARHGAIAIPSALFTTIPIEGDWRPAG